MAPDPSPPVNSRRLPDTRVTSAFYVVFALVAAWLLASLYCVNLEFDDGYTTIANAQYFIGLSDRYFWQRGPLIAALLMPAEWLAHFWQLHPLNVRVHHALMALLHLAAFGAVWSLLVQHFGARLQTLLAFLAANATVVFFGYAPFVSHDLLPGVVALYMLVLADRYCAAPGRRIWLTLAALGAFLALVKQTYALVWVAILIAHAAISCRESEHQRNARILIGLGSAAAASALVTWIVYASVLTSSFPDAPFWMRPWVQTRQFIDYFQQEGPIRDIIYQWVYLRNLSAYGILAMALALPGVILSLRRGTRLQQSVAIAWIAIFAMMQALAFKEVRYLAYLAPLTAWLLVPALDWLWRLGRVWRYFALGVLAFDLASGVREGLRIVHPYYRTQVTQFLAALPSASDLRRPIIMIGRLSFLTPESWAFFGDRYHRIINLNQDQIRLLYGYPPGAIQRVDPANRLQAGPFPPGTLLIFSNDIAARVPPIPADNRTSLQPHFAQLIARAEPVSLVLTADRYVVAPKELAAGAQRRALPSTAPLMLLPARGVTAEPLTGTDSFPAASLKGILGDAPLGSRVDLVGFRIIEYCNIDGCRSLGGAMPAQE